VRSRSEQSFRSPLLSDRHGENVGRGRSSSLLTVGRTRHEAVDFSSTATEMSMGVPRDVGRSQASRSTSNTRSK